MSLAESTLPLSPRRRNLVGLLAASVAVAATGAAAAHLPPGLDPDAVSAAATDGLRAAWHHARAMVAQAEDAVCRARERAAKQYPRVPDGMIFDARFPGTRERVLDARRLQTIGLVQGTAWLTRQSAMRDDFIRQLDAIDDANGVVDADRTAGNAVSLLIETEKRVVAAPAGSVRDLDLKLAVLASWKEESDVGADIGDLIDTIAADAAALARKGGA